MEEASATETGSQEIETALWACVEIFGHRKHYGRISEVEQFGTKMIRVDVPSAEAGRFDTFFYGGAAIFSVTPCTEESARSWAERMRPKPYIPRRELPPPEDEAPDEEAEF